MQLFSQYWGEAVASSSGVEQLSVLVVAEDESIEGLWIRRVPADHEFLPLINAHLSPGSGSPARLIGAAEVLRNNALQSLCAHCIDYIGESGVQLKRFSNGML